MISARFDNWAPNTSKLPHAPATAPAMIAQTRAAGASRRGEVGRRDEPGWRARYLVTSPVSPAGAGRCGAGCPSAACHATELRRPGRGVSHTSSESLMGAPTHKCAPAPYFAPCPYRVSGDLPHLPPPRRRGRGGGGARRANPRALPISHFAAGGLRPADRLLSQSKSSRPAASRTLGFDPACRYGRTSFEIPTPGALGRSVDRARSEA